MGRGRRISAGPEIHLFSVPAVPDDARPAHYLAGFFTAVFLAFFVEHAGLAAGFFGRMLMAMTVAPLLVDVRPGGSNEKKLWAHLVRAMCASCEPSMRDFKRALTPVDREISIG
jgi:hypothetical protein